MEIHDRKGKSTTIVYTEPVLDQGPRVTLVATLERWRKRARLPPFFEVRVDDKGASLGLLLLQKRDDPPDQRLLFLSDLNRLVDLFRCAPVDVSLTTYAGPDGTLLSIHLAHVTWPGSEDAP